MAVKKPAYPKKPSYTFVYWQKFIMFGVIPVLCLALIPFFMPVDDAKIREQKQKLQEKLNEGELA